MDLAVVKMIFSQEFWIMSICWPLSLLYSYFQLLFFSSSPSYPRCSFSYDSKSKIKKPICIITGPTSGLGLAATHALVNKGYHVILGILAAESRVTCDGYDEMVETNYFGAFLLTKLLLPLLENSPIPSRIVNVSSFTHYSVSNAKVDKESLCCLPTSRNYPLAHIYQYSKLCLLLFSYELHRRLDSRNSSATVSVNAADPGAVETKLMRELPLGLSQFAFTVLRLLHLLKSPEEGVASIIDAALAPPKVSGKYFFGGKGRTIRSSLISYNSELAENLWSSTDVLLQESLSKNGYFWPIDR